jgi:hypothetical protein
VLFKCVKNAENMGSKEERHNVEKRLEDIQNLASANLAERLKALDISLFQSFRNVCGEEAQALCPVLTVRSTIPQHQRQT